MTYSKLFLALVTLSMIAGCGSSNDSSTIDELDSTTADDPITDENANNADSQPVPLDTIREDLLNALAGYQSESLATTMYEVAANVQATATPVPLTGTVISTEVVSFNNLSLRNSFDCQFGGTMILESINTDESLGGAAAETNGYDRYEFDQCVTASYANSQSDTNVELNGSYTYETHLRSSSGGSFGNNVATWDRFTLQQVNGISYEFVGTLTLGTLANSGSAETTRDSQIARYVESSGDTNTIELTDVDFFQKRRPIVFSDRVEGPREVRINGSYTGPLSQDTTLQVSTDPVFSESISSSAEFNEPLTGSLQISSTDGGVLTMTANGPLTISFLKSDGTTSESVLDEFPVFDVRGSGCVPGGGFIDELAIEDCLF